MKDANIIARQLIENKSLRDEIERLKGTDGYCNYCARESSMGNESLSRCDCKDVYIFRDRLCILENDNPMAIKIKINYCPICGNKLYKEE